MQNPIETSKRHNETQNDIAKNSIVLMGSFSNPSEKTLFMAVGKIEKITAAVYLVTDVMDANLPLTASLRRETIDLLNACFALIAASGTPRLSDVSRIGVRIEQCISLVSIGRISHHISDMNAAIIIKELSAVLDSVVKEIEVLSRKYSSFQSSGASQPIISHALFQDDRFASAASSMSGRKTAELVARSGAVQNDISKRHINDIESSQNVVYQKLNSQEKDTNESKKTIKTTLQKSSGVGSKERRESIMNVIKSHKDASLQDIKTYIPDVSDKTLQREIAGMIETGLIIRNGNKRWATYALAR